jgi:hypothetical protein
MNVNLKLHQLLDKELAIPYFTLQLNNYLVKY